MSAYPTTHPASAEFLELAAGIGSRLVESAVTHDGRATWMADVGRSDGGRVVIGRLDADLAGGTAGVGWFLGRLGALTADPSVCATAVGALTESMRSAPSLVDAGRLGWYSGALGVAWAAADIGALLGDDELLARGRLLASEAAAAVPEDGAPPWLVGGLADVVVGLVAVAVELDEPAEPLSTWSTALIEALTLPTAGSARAPGMARGTTGSSLALTAATRLIGDEGVQLASTAERLWLEPGAGWYAKAAHDDQSSPTLDTSWCAGAAGIGLARLAQFVESGDPSDLADAGAAVEIVRAGMSSGIDPGPTLCHGWPGTVELMLTAGSLFGEVEHVRAAQRTARLFGAPSVDSATGRPNPSMLHGLAGVGVTMLRLASHSDVTSPALPSFLLPT